MNIFTLILIVLIDIYIIYEINDDYKYSESFMTSGELDKFYRDNNTCNKEGVPILKNKIRLKDIDPNIKQNSFIYGSVLPDTNVYDPNVYLTFLE